MNQFFRFFCINLVLPLVYHMKAAHQQCSMQMLTDWSRTMFPKVVFTPNIIKAMYSD
jgi:hypothetical protein